MKNIKYILLCTASFAFLSCNDIEDVDQEEIIIEEQVDLTAGTADFSTYVSIGNSLTAGFTDNALFIASQENSMPNMLSQKFALAGGGSFVQPLMNDNYGGVAVGGTRILEPRLVFDGSGPAALESLIGDVTVTTDLLVNNPTGPFNNLGVPGAKSFHLLAPGYGNLANVSLGLANPYFVRMTGATPDASVLELALAQSPSFVSLWIGSNDVLGYALSGGDGSDEITPLDGDVGVGFNATYATIIGALAASGAQGVAANIPDITSIPHFTTVPYNPLDPTDATFGAQIATLNGVFGQLNQVFAFLQVSERSIVFSETEASAVVVKDETLVDLSAEITAVLNASTTFPTFVESFGLPAAAASIVANLFGVVYGQARQATADDLFVLPSSSIIGEINTEAYSFFVSQGLSETLAAQFSVEGVSYPLDDKWVLLPSEQEEIATAISAFNSTIEASVTQAGFAFVDVNSILNQLANGGVTSEDYILTSNLVTGGAFSLDGVHPTAKGYAFLANEFLTAIDETYDSNFEASGSLLDLLEYPTNYAAVLE
ncbi:G-D-S-L family lipolytic protein [Cellulophaga baltica]|uniref:G-D-S-L family lipolytic protein n=1 Tax=Cellulophaga TaxID=104264 RepID=UPI001C06F6F6|nr:MULTISPECIES: G-D-S-L family lipolytic protein [Cellulophaga]MBU2995657.1 G-D-S-L family lipolytic protein [Cellulophaga baltica]MDO6767051.1 G-D-S-L family lipolytic protein [Cellulophaga sp. 1_MG-2023]